MTEIFEIGSTVEYILTGDCGIVVGFPTPEDKAEGYVVVLFSNEEKPNLIAKERLIVVPDRSCVADY